MNATSRRTTASPINAPMRKSPSNSYNNGKPVTGRAADFSNQIVWDENRKCYLLLCREDYGAGGGVGELQGVRIMAHDKDNDLINHPTAWKTLTKFILNDPDRSIVPSGPFVAERQTSAAAIHAEKRENLRLPDSAVRACKVIMKAHVRKTGAAHRDK